MAYYLLQNRKPAGVTIVKFNFPDLGEYSLKIVTSKSPLGSWSRLVVPEMRWRHHDPATALDVIDGLKLAAGYITRIASKPNIPFRGYGGEPVFNDGNITAQIFKGHAHPQIQLNKRPDGYYEWVMESYRCDNDAAGLARIAGTILRVIEKAQEVL